MNQTSILLAWSGGKDSLWALHTLHQNPTYTVKGLLTTIVQDDLRIGMHGVRQSLLQAQAASLGLELIPVLQPAFPNNEIYEKTFSEAIAPYRQQGIDTIAYGDLFLEDIREFRDTMMGRLQMNAIYPIWQQDTTALAQEIIRSGYEITVVCVDTEQLDGAFIGRRYDAQFLSDLPDHVDPCGENGEFHTFVSDGALFKQAVPFKIIGRFIRHNRFLHVDLIAEDE